MLLCDLNIFVLRGYLRGKKHSEKGLEGLNGEVLAAGAILSQRAFMFELDDKP